MFQLIPSTQYNSYTFAQNHFQIINIKIFLTSYVCEGDSEKCFVFENWFSLVLVSELGTRTIFRVSRVVYHEDH